MPRTNALQSDRINPDLHYRMESAPPVTNRRLASSKLLNLHNYNCNILRPIRDTTLLLYLLNLLLKPLA